MIWLVVSKPASKRSAPSRIVHELLHFFAPNHGKLWKSLMQAHLGDYEKAEERIKRTPLSELNQQGARTAIKPGPATP